jgi:hypothetical protein
MKPAEERFAKAYLAYKLKYAEDVEPLAKDYGLHPKVAEAIAIHVHQQFERERVKRATDCACTNKPKP